MADTDTDLYRSCQTRSLGKGNATARMDRFVANEGATSLYPNMGFTRKDGSVRPADITTEKDTEDNIWVPNVSDDSTEGVSVSKTRGGFGYGGWAYFLIPDGTEIPAGLDVAASPTRRDKGHYSIRCRTRMRFDTYQGALDNLARNAVVKATEQGVPVLYFKA